MPAQVSIVLRTKDRPLLLRRALSSIADQTYADWRIVLVNDSLDPEPVTAAVGAAGLAEDDRLVRVQRELEQPFGVAAALNAGLAVADGRYVAIHDDDDTWAESFLAATVGELEAHPEFAAVGVTTELIRERIDGDGITELERAPLSTLDRFGLIDSIWAPYVPPIAMLIRREAIERLGGFDPTLPVLEDLDLTWRLLAAGPLGYVNDPLARWHHRDDTGATGNTVVAMADVHQRYNALLRDRYLRRSLGSPADLGPTMATAYLLREIEQRQAGSFGNIASRLEELQRGVGEQISVSHLEQRLAVERVRGELLAMQATVDRLVALVEDSDRRQRATLRLVRAIDKRVADIWSSSRAVAKLVRGRGSAGRS